MMFRDSNTQFNRSSNELSLFSLIFLRFQRTWALINKLLLIWLFRAIAIIILKLCHVKISYTTHLNIWNISNDHEVQVM